MRERELERESEEVIERMTEREREISEAYTQYIGSDTDKEAEKCFW